MIYYNAWPPKGWTNLDTWPLTPQYKALGNHTIHAIPEGYVQRLPDGRYEVHVEKVFYFINDSFNFEGDEFLGYWKLNPDEEATDGLGFNTALVNDTFRDFQRHGYGRYFTVLSKLHEPENFAAKKWIAGDVE